MYEYHYSEHYDADTSRYRPLARMAKLKYNFRTKIARIEEQKSDDAYVDSGATHHFFHSRGVFLMYDPIGPESVQVAHGKTKIIGKRTLVLSIHG